MGLKQINVSLEVKKTIQPLYYNKYNNLLYKRYDFHGHLPDQKSEHKIFRYFRHPEIKGTTVCEECKIIHHHHAWIDKPDIKVCPGSIVFISVSDPSEAIVLGDINNQRTFIKDNFLTIENQESLLRVRDIIVSEYKKHKTELKHFTDYMHENF